MLYYYRVQLYYLMMRIRRPGLLASTLLVIFLVGSQVGAALHDIGHLWNADDAVCGLCLNPAQGKCVPAPSVSDFRFDSQISLLSDAARPDVRESFHITSRPRAPPSIS